MTTDLAVAPLPANTDALQHWKVLGTVVWGVVVSAVFLIVQAVAAFVVVLSQKNGLTDQQFESLLKSAESNGVVVSVSTIAGALVCVPLIVGIIKLKQRSNIASYLALQPVPARSLALWLCALALFVVLSDGLTHVLGRPVVPEFMSSAYSSAHPTWLLWLALVVAAPAVEETFFRGFLFKGLASSFMGPTGAIGLTAVLWAGAHAQYDLYGMGTVFGLGVLFGCARMFSGSLWVPMAMHAASNVVSSIETAFVS